jgi:hypothetical protein
VLDRVQRAKLMRALKKGDVLMVIRLDRLAHSTLDLLSPRGKTTTDYCYGDSGIEPSETERITRSVFVLSIGAPLRMGPCCYCPSNSPLWVRPQPEGRSLRPDCPLCEVLSKVYS